MERGFKRKKIIALFLAIFTLTGIFTNNVFAEDEEIFKFDIANITIGAGGAGGNSTVSLKAIPKVGGSSIERSDTINGSLTTGPITLSEGTEVTITVKNDDWGGKAEYSKEEKINATMTYSSSLEKVEEAKVKDLLKMDSLLMKDYLKDDEETFEIKFELGEEFKEYFSGENMNHSIRINIDFPISYRGEIIPTAVVGSTPIINDGIKFTGENDGYEYDAEISRHFARGGIPTTFKVSFPGEYVFDTWQFTDFPTISFAAKGALGLTGAGDLKNNPIAIKPNYSVEALKTLGYNIKLKAILKDSPKVTFDPNFGGLESKEIQTNSGKVVLPKKSDFTQEGKTVYTWHYDAEGSGDKIEAGTVITEDITLYAKWIDKEDAVFVVPDLNYEGSEDLEDITTRKNGTITLPQAPTREHYKFLGWYTDNEGGEEVTIETRFENDTTIYAHWEFIDYIKLNFLVNNEKYSQVEIDKELKLGNQLPEIKEPIEGYYFRGWYTEENGGGIKLSSDTDFSDEGGNEKNIYAHLLNRESSGDAYGVIYIDFQYKTNTGSNNLSKPQNNITGELEWHIPDSAPSEGLIFKGWYTAEEGGEKIEEGTIFLKETQLYAQWRSEKITIDFNLNGGTGNIAPVEADSDGKITLPSQEPTRTGYKFLGWFDSREGGNEITESTVFDDDTTIYAQWEKEQPEEKIIITFDLNGGTGNIAPVEADSDGKITLPSYEPTRTGYKFLGWFDSREGGNEITGNTIFEEDTTIYAHWEKESERKLNITKVRLEKDGSVISHGKISGTDITLLVNLSDEEVAQLRDAGYTMVICSSPGTLVKQEGQPSLPWESGIINGIDIDQPTKFTVYREDDEDGETKDYILTIKRYIKDPELYTVTFNTNGGSTISPVQVKDGDKVSKPANPTKPGYKFDGWYRDVLFRYEYDFNTAITDHRELFAKWKEVEEPIDPKEPTNELPRILKFSLLGYEASIDDRNERITINIPYNMDLGSLVPSITITEGATISPSKDSAVNFNRTVYYTVYGSGNTQKTYRVIINIPSDRDSRYWDDYYDNYKKERDDYYKRRGEISWWELAKEAKEKRAEEELKIKSERDEKLVLKERAKILNDVGKIESRARNSRSSLMINDRFNHIEIRPTVSDFKSGFSNIITIPKDVLPNLLKGEYEFIKYHTGVVNIEIYPSMETVSGLKLNLCDIPKDIREKWNKVKGKGYIFQVESDSTKGGLSYEINLEKQYPVEKLRFVKYNYMKGNFEDVSPEKWYVFNGKLRCDKVSSGIYGIIYKD